MALFFNLNTLEQESGGDTTKFLKMLYYHWDKVAPIRKSDSKFISKVNLIGHSYLLNPKQFFDDKTTDPIFKVQYIKLAGRRDYNLFKQYKYVDLQLSFFPDIIMDSIKHNPLLLITPTEIKFKYESNKWH